MAAAANPLTITWKGTSVGGATDYQLDGPYTIEKSYDRFLMVFDVVVVASDYEDLHQKSDALEALFSNRLAGDEALVIDIDGTAWTYTSGQTIFDAVPTITKSGDPQLDYGLTRTYTVKIEGQLPDDSGGGLREFQVLVAKDNTRRRTVTMQGQYFASSAGDATSRYLSNFDAEASTYLTFVDSSAAWELVDESYTIDRQPGDDALPRPHRCNFSRQYLEIIDEQALGQVDDPAIVDHRVTFTDIATWPLDSSEDAQRLRQVYAQFDCGVDVTVTKDLAGTYAAKVRPLLSERFASIYQPQQFAVEEQRVSYDRTNNRIAASLIFTYQASNATELVEVSETVTYEEDRNIEYTKPHNGDELAAYADPGTASVLRIWDRVAVAIGQQSPNWRISNPGGAQGGVISDWTQATAGVQGPDTRDATQIQESGWNVIKNRSSVTPQFIGDKEGAQRIEVSVLTEQIIERFHRKPTNGTSAGGTTGPVTGGTTTGPITQGGSQ
jgi:hypothetical protein